MTLPLPMQPTRLLPQSAPPLLIRRLDAIPLALPLKKPVSMAGVRIAQAHNILVRIEAASGVVGWGEAASAPSMTGDTPGSLLAAVEYLKPLLLGQNVWQHRALTARLRRALLGNTGAHSAIEMALLDLAGRAENRKVVELIGGAVRQAVAPMWLIGNPSIEQDAEEAVAKMREGFLFFKLKVATKGLEQDIRATHALRGVLGPDLALCADANCGMSAQEALDYIAGARGANVLFLEQPLGADELSDLATLARSSSIPIGADEGIHAIGDIEAHASRGVAGISLKLIKLGGFSGALDAAAACARLGLKINVAAKIAESSLATAAALQLACALPSLDWGVSLTHFYLADDIAKAPLRMRDGSVSLPAGAGLGIEVDERAIARLRVGAVS